MNPDLILFTDGACRNNGKKNAIAGLGIYVSENDPRNVSERIQGKQTNNRAELSAFIRVFSQFSDEIQSQQTIHVYTDSEYVMKCCGYFGQKSKQNGWKNKKGWIMNHDLVQQAYNLHESSPNVTLFHIKAHTGKQDMYSIGNDGADRLANLSLGPLKKESSNTPYFLNVPYARKEEAKQHGCRWNPKQKRWYSTDKTKKSMLQQLFP